MKLERKEPSIENGRCAHTVKECLDSDSVSSVLWCVRDCSTTIRETPLFLFLFLPPFMSSCLLSHLDHGAFTHFSIPFTLFQFLSLICCFVLFFSPQLYHAALPLFFPLLCLLTFLGSCLLFGDHRMPVTPRAPDPVPISFAFSE